jgi:hypothetical protein
MQGIADNHNAGLWMHPCPILSRHNPAFHISQGGRLAEGLIDVPLMSIRELPVGGAAPLG